MQSNKVLYRWEQVKMVLDSSRTFDIVSKLERYVSGLGGCPVLDGTDSNDVPVLMYPQGNAYIISSEKDTQGHTGELGRLELSGQDITMRLDLYEGCFDVLDKRELERYLARYLRADMDDISHGTFDLDHTKVFECVHVMRGIVDMNYRGERDAVMDPRGNSYMINGTIPIDLGPDLTRTLEAQPAKYTSTIVDGDGRVAERNIIVPSQIARDTKYVSHQQVGQLVLEGTDLSLTWRVPKSMYSLLNPSVMDTILRSEVGNAEKLVILTDAPSSIQ